MTGPGPERHGLRRCTAPAAADQGPGRIQAGHGGNCHRLARIKAADDPDDFFRFNNNIPPEASAR
jgi:hypothetical protein